MPARVSDRGIALEHSQGDSETRQDGLCRFSLPWGQLKNFASTMDPPKPVIPSNEQRLREWDATVEIIERRANEGNSILDVPCSPKGFAQAPPPFPLETFRSVSQLCKCFETASGVKVCSDSVRRWARQALRPGNKRISLDKETARELWGRMHETYVQRKNTRTEQVTLRGQRWFIVAELASRFELSARTCLATLRGLISDGLVAPEEVVKITSKDELAEVRRQYPALGRNQRALWIASLEAIKFLSLALWDCASGEDASQASESSADG